MSSFVFRAAAAELALKRKLSFPVSKMWHRWVRRSSSAVAILASPNTVAHSLKLRLVVMRCLAGECAAIAEKDDAGTLVELAQQVEEQRSARGAERQVAHRWCVVAGDGERWITRACSHRSCPSAATTSRSG